MKGWSLIQWQNQESKNKIMDSKTGSFNKRIINIIKYETQVNIWEGNCI